MRRTLVLIRHANTKPAKMLQDDFDRRLTDQGELDAQEMGTRLRNYGLLPDLIVASTAVRAAQTARAIAASVRYEEQNIQWEQHLYLCHPDVFESILWALPEEVKTVFIIAHNPGITQFANALSAQFQMDNMPTCGVVGAHVLEGAWTEFSTSKKEVFLSDYPKKYI